MTIAYLDPGSGSLIASALVGGVAAAGVAAKQARARFSVGLGRKRKQQADVPDEDSTTDEPVDAAADGPTVEAADDAAPVRTES